MKFRPGCPTPEQAIAATAAWIERAVIGLNLCPFAQAVYVKRQIRFAVSAAETPAALLADLQSELRGLVASDPATIETTLLIHPQTLTDFLDYNDFLDAADAMVASLGLVGVVQIASFHPAYQFADSPGDDVANATNRSPYPMLHLLREASVEKAVAAVPDAGEIHQRNVATMRRLGWAGLTAMRLVAPPTAPS